MAMPFAACGSRVRPAAGRLPRARAWCWRPGDFRTMQGFASGSFPTAAGSISAAAPAGTETACVSRWRAAPTSAPVSRMPAYWVPASLFRRADGSQGVFPHTVTDRAKPGIIAVNASGRRFVNEALSYHEFVRAMLADGNDTAGRPFYLVCDRRFLWTYGLGRIRPFTRRIRTIRRSGELFEAPDVGALADLIGVERSMLTATVDNYNAHARMGLDPEFGRGTHDLSASSRRCRPFAQSVRRTDRAGAVLRACGSIRRTWARRSACAPMAMRGCWNASGAPIAGLYACGNDMGSIMNGNYPGPGITLGPALHIRLYRGPAHGAARLNRRTARESS